jgi:hypothetical protein
MSEDDALEQKVRKLDHRDLRTLVCLSFTCHNTPNTKCEDRSTDTDLLTKRIDGTAESLTPDVLTRRGKH